MSDFWRTANKFIDSTTKKVVESLNIEQESNFAYQSENTSLEVSEVVLDLSTARTRERALEISFPFSYMVVESQSSSTIQQIFMIVNTRDDFQKGIALRAGESFECDRGVRKVFFYWLAGTGTVTLKFFVNSKVKKNLVTLYGSPTITVGNTVSVSVIGTPSVMVSGNVSVLSNRRCTYTVGDASADWNNTTYSDIETLIIHGKSSMNYASGYHIFGDTTDGLYSQDQYSNIGNFSTGDTPLVNFTTNVASKGSTTSLQLLILSCQVHSNQPYNGTMEIYLCAVPKGASYIDNFDLYNVALFNGYITGIAKDFVPFEKGVWHDVYFKPSSTPSLVIIPQDFVLVPVVVGSLSVELQIKILAKVGYFY